MCLAEPALVRAVEPDDTAWVDLRGVTRRVPLVVVTSSGATVAPGDWLLVQTGLAVAQITADEARNRISFLNQGLSKGADHEQG